MSMLDLGQMELKDAPELKVAEKDTEAKLRIVNVNVGVDKNGYNYILPTFELVGKPLIKDFTHFLHIPTNGMDEKKIARVKDSLKKFFLAFEVDLTRQIDPEEDLPGQEGWAILGMKEDEEYGEQNYIRRFIIPAF